LDTQTRRLLEGLFPLDTQSTNELDFQVSGNGFESEKLKPDQRGHSVDTSDERELEGRAIDL
jgi:hypothetical protein